MLNSLFTSFHFNETIFANRNQSYGAFQLRKQYSTSVSKALFITCGIISTLTFASFLSNRNIKSLPLIKKADSLILSQIITPVVPIIPPSSHLLIKHSSHSSNSTNNYKIKNDKDVLKISNSRPDNGQIGNSDDSLGLNIPDSHLTHPTVYVQPPSPPVIHKIVEKMPAYIGGEEAMMKFLSKHLHYTDAARKDGVSGLVVLSFVVNPDGRISDISTLRGLGYGLEEEATRVVKDMPAWKPGIQQGQAVPVLMSLPIHFQMTE